MDVKPPQLPMEVSSNGQEIWDWAGRLSRFTHLTHQARVLRNDIRDLPTRCGSCQRWMTRSCPKERPGTGEQSGYSVGPSMNGYRCGEFALKSSHSELIEKWQTELAEVEAKLAEFKEPDHG